MDISYCLGPNWVIEFLVMDMTVMDQKGLNCSIVVKIQGKGAVLMPLCGV